MINRLQGLKPLICSSHNQPITSFQQGQPMCQICINQLPGMISLDQFYKQLENYLLKENLEYEQQQQSLQQIWDSLVSYQTNINQHLEKIIQMIQESIGILKTQSQKFQYLIQKNNNQQQIICELEKELIKISQNNKSVRSLIENLLIEFQQKQSDIQPIIELLQQNVNQDIQAIVDTAKIPKKIQLKKKQSNNQPIIELLQQNVNQDIQAIDDTAKIPNKIFIKEVSEKEQMIMFQGLCQNCSLKKQGMNTKYNIMMMKSNSIKQNVCCYAVAFNKDNNILLVGSYQVIIIYEFNNGKLQTELQRLKAHTEGVICLQFLEEQNGFISGSYDSSIIIWNLNNNNQYVAKQTLSDHKGCINCLLINTKEDLLISSSDDETIKFWRVQNGSWNCLQTIETKNSVHKLSLNEMENKLISLVYWGCPSYILVYERQQDQQWVLFQKIQISEGGLGLFFTIGDQFVFQPRTKNYLEIYNYGNFDNKFYKLKQFQISCCIECCIEFPCQFISQLNIFIVKHMDFLLIFRENLDGNYLLSQKIMFKDYWLSGRVTDDGQYLISWDFQSDIQVWKLALI